MGRGLERVNTATTGREMFDDIQGYFVVSSSEEYTFLLTGNITASGCTASFPNCKP